MYISLYLYINIKHIHVNTYIYIYIYIYINTCTWNSRAIYCHDMVYREVGRPAAAALGTRNKC